MPPWEKFTRSCAVPPKRANGASARSSLFGIWKRSANSTRCIGKKCSASKRRSNGNDMPQDQLIRDSFEIVHEMPEAVAMLFYGRLFNLDPSLRGLFKVDMHTQSKK